MKTTLAAIEKWLRKLLRLCRIWLKRQAKRHWRLMTRNSNQYAAKSVAKTFGKCQYCRERIKKKAVKCKHCGESQLSGAELASYAEEQIFDNRLVALRAIAIWWFVWVSTCALEL